MEATEEQLAEVHGPESVIDFIERDVFAAEDVTDIHPVVVPADAAVVAHAADFALRGIRERGEARRVGP